jgi:hypothetical protein
MRKRDVLASVRAILWPGSSDAWAEYRSDGRLVWITDLFSWLPKRSHEMVDLADLPEEGLRKLYPDLVKASQAEPTDDPRLLKVLERLAGRRLSVLGPKTPPTLRASAWVKARGAPSIVAQLVNYDVPGPGTPEEGKVVPVEGVEVRLPIREGMKVSRVTGADPWRASDRDLAFSQRGAEVRFIVPRVEIYEAVLIG